MRMWWRTCVLILLGGSGCHQVPADKSVQELRPIQQVNVAAKKQELTAADITHTAWFANLDALEKAGKTLEAIALCEKMREPGNPHALDATRKLARLYHRLDELDRAELEYRKVLEQDPRDADTLAKLGDIAYGRKHWGVAHKHYSDALHYRKDHAFAWTGLGMAAAQLGNFDESFAAFNKVLPSQAEAYCQVAYFLNLQGKVPDAIRAYEQALKIEPKMPRANQELAKLRAIPTTATPVGRQVTVEPDAVIAPVGADLGRSQMQRPVLPPLRNVDANDQSK